MISKSTYWFILFLIFPFLSIKAQDQIFFPALEKSIASRERQKIELQFPVACNQILNEQKNISALLQLLDIAHELSRSGMAGLVWTELQKLSNDAVWLASWADSIKLNILSELGAASYYDNRFQTADSVFRLTIPIFEGLKTEVNLDYAFSCNFLGLAGIKLGKFDSSLAWFEKAKQVRIRALGENHPLVGAVFNNIGLLCKSKGDYEGAAYNYRKAILIKKIAHDKTVYLNLLNLGELYGVRGQYATALVYYHQADSILQHEVPSLKMADLYLNSGAMMYSLQGYHEAQDYFMKALRLYDSLLGENSEQSGKLYQNLANVYNGMDDLENEQKSIEKALAILEPEYGSDHPELAPLFNNLGMVYQNLRKFEKSLSYFYQARKIYLLHPKEQPEKLVNTLTNIATTRQMAGQTDSAVICYREAIEKLETNFGGRHPYLSYAYNALARIYLGEQKFEKADSMVNLAILSNKSDDPGKTGLLESLLDPGYLLGSLILKGQISWKSDPNSPRKAETAFEFFRKADTLLSLQRNFLFNTSDKITFARNARLLAESSLECVASGKTHLKNVRLLSDAFRYAEKSKNLVLLQSIQEDQARHISGIPDSILTREEKLRGNIHVIVHQMDLEKDKTNHARLADQLFRDQKAYRSLVETLEKNYPGYHDLKYSDKVPGIPVLQNLIGKESALLAYFTCDSSVYRFTILQKECTLDKQNLSDLEDLLIGMRKGITLRLDNVYREKAEKLGQLLIPSHLPDGIKKLVIVPDGGLSSIPFEALLYKQPDVNSEKGEWPFLIQKFIISYAPSLAIWKNLNLPQVVRSNNTSLLAFAPVFSKRIEIAESESGDNSAVNRAAFPLLAPLRASRDEVSDIDFLFRQKGFTSDLRLFAEATERYLVSSDLKKYAYIHIATHGFVNEKNPGLSGLYFFPSHDSLFDNILYLNEIYNLKLDAELVVLSACETGLGKMAAGEGILGFSRVFLLSGARNLLLSLWKVNDASTTELMTQFYKSHLENGIPLAESLRNAKLSLIRNPPTSHPYFWAPFVLSGN
jgi:CHAT domain-containing protein/Tfp pilus assembly protein PilF